MSAPQAVDIRTEPATGKAESIQQFRSLFQQHEPKLLAFADSLLNEFGRENISAVRIFCPVEFLYGKRIRLQTSAVGKR